MSEDNSNVSNETENQVNVSSNSTEAKDDYVRLSAYEEVKGDMFKYKSKSKEAIAKANELEAKLKSIEEEKLKEAQDWQALYEKERSQREELLSNYESERNSNINARKRAALKNEIGNVRDEYLNHANLAGIEVNDDGTLSPESIKEVANAFRKDHAVLIPTENANQITNQAPANAKLANSEDRTLKDLSYAEKAQMLADLKRNRS